ncbi:MAG TPA: LexA family transcriptional regulator [Luteibaculaceae bacterium]|nr:LexA family transcriptional regulator [Luteibaculaceae bacterium]
MHIHSNLKILRTRRGRTQAELAEALGMTRSQIAGYEHAINPTIDALLKLSDYFQVTVDTLLKADLSNYSEFQLSEIDRGMDVYINGNKLRVLATAVDSQNNDLIEVVSAKAKASYAAGFADPEYVGDLPRMSIPFLNPGRKYRVFQIDGDSMLPIPDRAYVTCEYVDDWFSIRDGEKYVVVTQRDGVVFKLVYNQIKSTGKLLLCSSNPIYAPFEVEIQEVKEVWAYRLTIS